MRWKSSGLEFLGSRRQASSSLIVFRRAKLSMRSITAGTTEGYFEGKTLREGHQGGGMFLHDNAPAHRALATPKKLAYLGFQCLDHLPYPPDLALSHYRLFPGLKKQLKGRHFSSDAGVIPVAETWLDGQPSEVF